jgi:hypothetical protein
MTFSQVRHEQCVPLKNKHLSPSLQPPQSPCDRLVAVRSAAGERPIADNLFRHLHLPQGAVITVFRDPIAAFHKFLHSLCQLEFRYPKQMAAPRDISRYSLTSGARRYAWT